MLSMLEYLPMSMPTRQELLSRFGKVDDPKIEARRQHILEVLLEASPHTQQLRLEGRLEGRLTEARAALRRVLARRQLVLTQGDDARIACLARFRSSLAISRCPAKGCAITVNDVKKLDMSTPPVKIDAWMLPNSSCP